LKGKGLVMKHKSFANYKGFIKEQSGFIDIQRFSQEEINIFAKK
jgi:hypothetical protein